MNDWKSEALPEGEDFVKFKGNLGDVVLKFLTEQPEIEEKVFDGKVSVRASWLVIDERDNKEKKYETAKAGINSVYGRLQKIAKDKDGIKDERVRFKWTGEGLKRNYWVESASVSSAKLKVEKVVGGNESGAGS